MRLFRFLLIGVLCASIPGLSGLRSALADSFDATAIVGQDLAAESIDLETGWAAGVLRVVVSGPGDPSAWTIRIDYGQGRSLFLDAAALKSRTIGTTAQGLTVDLPVLGGSRVAATVQPAGIHVRPINVLAISTVKPQQMIDGSDVRSVDDASSDLERTTAMAVGRLDVIDAQGGLSGVCTAFRVSTGYWLTAAHCIYREAGAQKSVPNVRWRLQPEAYAGRLEGALLLDAVPVASGIAVTAPTSASLLGPMDRDYAILRVEGDPGGVMLPLVSVLDAQKGMTLELLQYWKGEFAPPPGKAVSAGPTCAVRRVVPDDLDPLQCPSGLQHGCSSLGGASGGALLEAASFRLVGLHYGAGSTGKYNCALSAAAIVSDLCARHHSIAEQVAHCP